ncbi:carbohydrate sulfotransferase 15-like [Watersipora subatra]|uniref:carbohydrate sulfotransferase 15-like n=1 Tax=Watersipora subatra TaxID=2589382 RepID=UPI00355B9811
MLCYKLPPFDPRFKNPCFYEQVSEDDSDQSVYKNLIVQRMVPDVSIAAVQSFHRHWQSKRNGTGPRKQLRCLPYFFIIGMEKCGTTDLYQRISKHPDVALSMAKELQWWTRRRFFYSSNNTFPKGLQSDEYKLQHTPNLTNVPFKHYYAFFDSVADQIAAKTQRFINGSGHHRTITGDGSPNTMYWNDFRSIYSVTGSDAQGSLVADHIAATLPQAKIIAILRNPADRLYSSYLFFNRFTGKIDFHDIVLRGIELFNNCIAHKQIRNCVYDPELKEKVGSTVNLMQGIYSEMLKDWLKVFPASQVHIVHFETYKQSELDSINKIFTFLDLTKVSPEEIIGQKIISQSKAFAGKSYEKAGQMLPQTRKLLETFYQPFNKALAQLLGDDRYLWAS